MEQAKKAIEKVIGSIVKIPKRILIIIIMFVIVIPLLGGWTYVANVGNSKREDKKWDSVPYAAGEYMNGLVVSEKGTFQEGITAQELWDRMTQEEECPVKKYLDTPEELEKLMRAEIVTRYPDMRPDPEAEIDWSTIMQEGNETQGIIKFKRKDTDNNTTTMKYASPEEFQSYIDAYNQTGSETAKQNALTHFTLRKTITTNGGTGGSANAIEGDGYNGEYTSSSGITYKEYKQGNYRDYGYWDGSIASSGCGPTSVAILASGLTDYNYDPRDTAAQMDAKYGYTGSGPLQGEMNSLGLNSEVIFYPSAEVIQNNLREGNVMLISVGKNGNSIFSNVGHIMALLDINEEGQIYVSNPGSKTGSGWFDVEELMKDRWYIVVTKAEPKENNIGTGTNITNSSNTQNNSQKTDLVTQKEKTDTTGYVAVVATWEQTNITITTDDPNVNPEDYNESNYIISTKKINYEEMVKQYTMPFDMLWALLVMGESKSFVMELADLIYQSDIQITIYDNVTINTDIDDWNYKEQTKAVVRGRIVSHYENGESDSTNIKEHEHDPHAIEKYKTTKTKIKQTNTINALLTKADTWIADYQNEYIYSKAEQGEAETSTVTQKDQEYSDQLVRMGNTYSCSDIDSIKGELIRKGINQSTGFGDSVLPNPVTNVEEILEVRYYHKYIEISDKIVHITSTQKYTPGTPIFKPKDNEETAPNFVTMFNQYKYTGVREKIQDADEWLYEVIEENEKIAHMADLVKYLIYKLPRKDSEGEFNYNLFMPGYMLSASFSITGNTVQERVWNALTSAGFSEIATAGAMGNIERESSFNPTDVTGGNSIGLFQWNWDGWVVGNPKSRRAKYEAYAASKGVDWTDVDTQIEYFLAEVGVVNSASNYASIRRKGAFCNNRSHAYYLEDWKNATTVDEATRCFAGFYESPASDAGVPKRQEFARKWYQIFTGNVAP